MLEELISSHFNIDILHKDSKVELEELEGGYISKITYNYVLFNGLDLSFNIGEVYEDSSKYYHLYFIYYKTGISYNVNLDELHLFIKNIADNKKNELEPKELELLNLTFQ